jgi:leucyl aminopeptidase (aminopeptidase T)
MGFVNARRDPRRLVGKPPRGAAKLLVLNKQDLAAGTRALSGHSKSSWTAPDHEDVRLPLPPRPADLRRISGKARSRREMTHESQVELPKRSRSPHSPLIKPRRQPLGNLSRQTQGVDAELGQYPWAWTLAFERRGQLTRQPDLPIDGRYLALVAVAASAHRAAWSVEAKTPRYGSLSPDQEGGGERVYSLTIACLAIGRSSGRPSALSVPWLHLHDNPILYQKRRAVLGGAISSIELAAITHRVMASYLAVQRGEQVVIVADTRTDPALPDALAGQTLALEAEPVIVVMPPRSRSGGEPPEPVVAALVSADVVVAAPSRSIYHTEAKGRAQAAGVRGILNAPCAAGAWISGAMTADFLEIREVAERLADRLREGKEAWVTSPAGTDVMVSIDGREPKGWLTGICRNPGEISAFPGGEVSLPPVEGTASGRIVVEQVMTDIGPLSSPITWVVEEGHVVSIEGGPQARQLEEYIDGVAGATNIAELGIGTNPAARVSADITETKKRLGTAHMALGDSAGGYGGQVVSDVHLDGMILDCRVEVDGRVVVEGSRIRV